MPKDFSMDQNYPNPFNPSTTISYGIPDAGTVHLTVYDNLGREVATVVNEYKNAGYYQANFDAANAKGIPSGLSSGMYFLQITSREFYINKENAIGEIVPNGTIVNNRCSFCMVVLRSPL